MLYIYSIYQPELTEFSQTIVWTGNVTVGTQQFRVDFDTGSAVSYHLAAVEYPILNYIFYGNGICRIYGYPTSIARRPLVRQNPDITTV